MKRSPAPPVPRDGRYQLAQALMLVGMVVLALATLLAWRAQEPFATWYFCFAWWSYILLVDGWVYRHRGESLLLSHPRRFVFLSLWSVVLWFVFEAFNLRLQNWFYVDLPAPLLLRWGGYVLAFATVVPGLFETADLLETAGLVKSGSVRPLSMGGWVRPVFIALGALMLVLPFLWPAYFFPLVWGGFFFLLEPLNEKHGVSSLLSDWRAGSMKRFFLLLLSGFLCGLLWEGWNSIARARWAYSVPWVGEHRLFAMPVLGFLGFPPFAVEAFSMTATALVVWDRSPKAARFLYAAAAAAFVLFLCGRVDQGSVRSFQ